MLESNVKVYKNQRGPDGCLESKRSLFLQVISSHYHEYSLRRSTIMIQQSTSRYNTLCIKLASKLSTIFYTKLDLMPDSETPASRQKICNNFETVQKSLTEKYLKE